MIDQPIGRDPRSRVRMAVVPAGKGKRAVTRFRVLERFAGAALRRVPARDGPHPSDSRPPGVDRPSAHRRRDLRRSGPGPPRRGSRPPGPRRRDSAAWRSMPPASPSSTRRPESPASFRLLFPTELRGSCVIFADTRDDGAPGMLLSARHSGQVVRDRRWHAACLMFARHEQAHCHHSRCRRVDPHALPASQGRFTRSAVGRSSTIRSLLPVPSAPA